MTGGPVAPAVSWAPLGGAHWLHPQKTSRVPRRYVFVDCEARRGKAADGEVQTWRLGCSATVLWNPRKRCWGPVRVERHDTPEDLWGQVAGAAVTDGRTVVVAHNLGYDLRVSRCLEILPAQGWEIRKPTFAGDSVSLELHRDGRVLVLVDSFTVIPHRLATIGEMLGRPKLPLPADDDPDETWWDRCGTDVEILADAYLSVVDRLAADDLGGWGRSGSAIGWHVLLRRHLHDRVLVHGDETARGAEAAAMGAGRCEVWRHGRLEGGPWHEWDYRMAYAYVCTDTPLPTVLAGRVHRVGLDTIRRPPTDQRWLVEATVTTDVELLPWRDETGVCWPVGTFYGWWWETELAAALDAGAQVVPHGGWRYRAAPWLAGFAAWCIAQQDMADTPADRVWAAVAKHWARTVVGRTAMRYPLWVPAGEAWTSAVTYLPLKDVDDGRVGGAMMLGGQRWETWSTEWSDNALPQVLSAVMAECRLRLWQAMTTAGLDHVVYVNTDCVLVDGDGHARLLEATGRGGLGSLRYKGAHARLELVAPQMVEGSSYRRLPGVPRGARQVEPGVYEGEVWDRLASSLADGTTGQVRVRRRVFRPDQVDTRRIHLDGGLTAPVRLVDGRRPNMEVRTA